MRNPEVATGYAEMQAELARQEEGMREVQAMTGVQGTKSTAASTHTFLSAALEVLRGAQAPLTSNQITDEALRRGLLTTSGKTPRRTMAACLYTLSKRVPDAPIERVFTPGAGRARRGSVRWRLRDAQPK